MVSRVAKNPVEVPKGVEITLAGKDITVKGKLGALTQSLHASVIVSAEEGFVKVVALNESIESNALAGTTRALIQNMVTGVNEGFERRLELLGVGYRAKAAGDQLSLSLGFSHPVELTMPKGIKVDTPSATEIVLTGADKQAVSQVAANIRRIRPPEPYKGKGVRYKGEQIILKEGKKK